ncbi:MAG: PP2C family protein-serine/threonine phosphatase [Acidobacteriota bacterium]
MARFASVSAIVYLVGAIVSAAAPHSPFGILQGIGFVGLLISAAYYGSRLFRWLKDQLLWKVRNKLIISFAFVGFIPVVILASLAWFSVTLIFRQLSVVYLENEFDQISGVLHETSERILLTFYQSDHPSQELLEELIAREQSHFVARRAGLNATSFSLLKRDPEHSSSFQTVARFPEGSGKPSSPVIPGWAQAGFGGLVVESKKLYFKSLQPVRTGTAGYLIYLDLPVDDLLSDYVRQRTSIETRLFDPASEMPVIADFFSSASKFSNIRWAHVLSPTNWANGGKAETAVHGILLDVPLKTLFQYYFTQSTGFGRAIVVFIAILGAGFIVVELVSLVIGAAIARTITRSVHSIDAGTRSIQAGNFDFRIPSKDKDQLDSVASAFNRMSESIVELMQQVSEKERLDKEIEIAREVQTHLFPREIPFVQGLQLAGTCLPARRVSGDYYDFIPYGDGLLDLIVSDISGKGISAALLMASLQSSMRSQMVYQSLSRNGESPIAQAVSAINRQLYTYTAPDKFATLVLSRVDTENLTLTYCNAGHNPPLLISKGVIQKLSTGGTVAGLFQDPEYEEETVALFGGDVVVFYTDGVVEAENPKGEQFDEEQLEELLRTNAFLTADDLRRLVIGEISRWVAGREQRDDITVVTLKVDPSVKGPASESENH